MIAQVDKKSTVKIATKKSKHNGNENDKIMKARDMKTVQNLYLNAQKCKKKNKNHTHMKRKSFKLMLLLIFFSIFDMHVYLLISTEYDKV